MMRIVVFDVSGILEAFDYRGVMIHKQEIQADHQITENKTQSLEAIKEAKTNASNEINTNKTASIEAITQAKTNANNEISTNQTQAITNINEAIGQPKEQAKNEISGAKKPIIIKTLIFFEIE
ncbi:histidinol dehydrogenase [Helicobacter pylori]